MQFKAVFLLHRSPHSAARKGSRSISPPKRSSPTCHLDACSHLLSLNVTWPDQAPRWSLTCSPQHRAQHAASKPYRVAYRWGVSGRCYSHQQLVEEEREEGKKGGRGGQCGHAESRQDSGPAGDAAPTSHFHHTTTSGSTCPTGAQHQVGSGRQERGPGAASGSGACRGHAVSAPGQHAPRDGTAPGPGRQRHSHEPLAAPASRQ